MRKITVMKRITAMVIIVAFMGCASIQTKPYLGMALTKATAEEAMSVAVVLYMDGTLSKEKYSKFRGVYEKGRMANDAVINALQMALDLGTNPDSNPNYLAALVEFEKLIGSLAVLAIEFQLIDENGEVR